jgi:hypothetical protein
MLCVIKKKKSIQTRMVAHPCNPSTEVGGSWVQDQPELSSETCLKKKKKKKSTCEAENS